MEFNQFVELFQKYGWSTTVTLYLIWDRVINPMIKKRKGVYVSWKSLKDKLDQYCAEIQEFQTEVKSLKGIINDKDHALESLQKGQERIERNQQEVNYLVRDLDTNLKTNNRLMGLVKDFLEKRTME